MRHDVHRALTVVGHAHSEALVKTAVLALVTVLLLDLTAALTLVVLQLQAYGSPEKTLQKIHTGRALKVALLVLIYRVNFNILEANYDRNTACVVNRDDITR